MSFNLSCKDHPEQVLVRGAWVIDKLNIPSAKVSKKGAAERWSHLSSVDLLELDGSNVTILIRSDMAHLLVHLDVRQGQPASRSLLGHLSGGPFLVM